ncbi:MAG: class I mannose-6-phosphate isomerase [Oscillospiraceae bacterium]|nr:class I mannose-6-phosphate isomerase [Oscillospiraceae bacterium]
MKPLKQYETRVRRTYTGGKRLDAFLGKSHCENSFYPEDWISSFCEAKNKEYVKNEGITRVECGGKLQLITDVVSPSDFGKGRSDAGVLIKYLDAAERLGIQVHPTKEYSRKHFNSEYGKTECWYVLGAADSACVYLGFKPEVTREKFKDLFNSQDIAGMLEAMHRFDVHEGDVILVTGGMPHAIGEGCFLLEIQEPSDYTMRAETTTVSGLVYTPEQIHYGVGYENMLDCFDYTPKNREEIIDAHFLKGNVSNEATYAKHTLISYLDTPYFALDRITCQKYTLNEDSFVTVIALSSGNMIYKDEKTELCRGDKYFISANCDDVVFKDADILICYPPKLD